MNVGRETVTLDVVQHRRPADPGRLALSFLRDQSGAQVRPRQGARLPARHSGRHRGALRARPEPHGAPRRHRRQARGLRLPPGGDGQGVSALDRLPFSSVPMSHPCPHPAMRSRRPPSPAPHYADMFGPTTGDRVRLADTELFIEVEKDFTTYGEEVKFGGGKVIRDGMGQAQTTNARGAVDTVITNARHPRSLGHRQGRHRHQGRADRRDRQGRQSRHPARRRPSSSARAPR